MGIFKRKISNSKSRYRLAKFQPIKNMFDGDFAADSQPTIEGSIKICLSSRGQNLVISDC